MRKTNSPRASNHVPFFGRSTSRSALCAWLGAAVLLLAGAGRPRAEAGGTGMAQDRTWWRDVTLRLHGALPTQNPRFTERAAPGEAQAEGEAKERPSEEKAFIEKLKGRAGGGRGGKGSLGGAVSLKAGEHQFTVMPFGVTPEPAVKALGEGKEAKVVVGKRTIGFDGEKIVLGSLDEAAGAPAK